MLCIQLCYKRQDKILHLNPGNPSISLLSVEEHNKTIDQSVVRRVQPPSITKQLAIHVEHNAVALMLDLDISKDFLLSPCINSAQNGDVLF